MPLGDNLGAELGAPADPAENYSAARPETYFLFLFQLLKYLEVFPPIVGAIVVPGLVMLSLFLMPIHRPLGTGPSVQRGVDVRAC